LRMSGSVLLSYHFGDKKKYREGDTEQARMHGLTPAIKSGPRQLQLGGGAALEWLLCKKIF